MHDLTPHWCQRTEYWTVLSACPDMELGEKKRVRLRSIKKGKKKKRSKILYYKASRADFSQSATSICNLNSNMCL